MILDGLKGVLCDLDGTLIDSECVHEKGHNTFFEEKGIIPFPQHIPGVALETIFRKYGEETGDEANASKLMEEYLQFISDFLQDNIENIHFFDDALIFLESIREMANCIVTTSYSSWFKLYDKHLKLSRFFKHQITKDDVFPFVKPHPKPYVLAAAKLGLNPAECLAIEDSCVGIQSAINAGCTVVVIQRTVTSSLNNVVDCKNVFLVKSLDDIVE